MKILLIYFLRIIKKNWLSFALILLSLSLVSSTVYINLNIDSDVFQNCENQMSQVYHGFDASLEIADSDYALDGDTSFPNVDRCLSFSIGYESTKLKDYSSSYLYMVNTKLEKAEEYQLITLVEGKMPSKENEVLIGKSKADALSLSIGDTLSIKGGELAITGFASFSSTFEVAYPNIVETFGELRPESKCNFFLLDYSCDEKSLLSSLPISEENYTFSVFEIDTFSKTRELKIVFGFVLVMIGIVAAFVIFSSSTMIIDSQEKAMATFASVGASKKMITSLLLGEGIIEGLLGGFAGIFFGEFFRYLIYHFYLAGEGYIIFSTPLYSLIAFAFTFLLQFGVSLLSILQFHSRTGKDNLLKIEKEKSPFLKFLPCLGFLLIATGLISYFTNVTKNLVLLFVSMGSFFVGFILVFSFIMRLLFECFSKLFKKHSLGAAYLASNSLSKEKINIRNTLLTTLVLSLSFVSLFISSSMNTFFTAYSERYNYDILVRARNGYALSEKDCDWIVEYSEGVDHLVKEYCDVIDTTVNGKTTDREIYYVKENEDIGGIKYLDYDIHNNSLKEGECLMDELMARHYGFNLGDDVYIHFFDPENGHRDFSVTIIGYCDSSIFNDDRETIIVSDEDYFNNITTSIRRLGIVLKEGVSVTEYLATLRYLSYSRKASQYFRIQDVNEYVQNEYEEVNRVITLVGFIPIFISLLSVLGLVNNELLLFAEKKRSYAVLASTCMSKGRLCFLIFLELLLMFITGIVFALLFDSFFIFLVRDALYVLFTYTEINISFVSLLGFISATFLILGVGFAFFSRQIIKMNTVKEIRYE